MSDLTIAIGGNPNCGKTTLFNELTGTQQRVGNWPGVTVEKKVGQFVYKGKRVKIVDLPGVYSLSAAGGSTSLDEQIARDFILSGEPTVDRKLDEALEESFPGSDPVSISRPKPSRHGKDHA